MPGPAADDGSRGAMPGGQLKPALNRHVFDRFTTLGRAAARQFNEGEVSEAR